MARAAPAMLRSPQTPAGPEPRPVSTFTTKAAAYAVDDDAEKACLLSLPPTGSFEVPGRRSSSAWGWGAPTRRRLDPGRGPRKKPTYDDHDDHNNNNDHDHDDYRFLARNHERSIGWHVPYSARYQCRWNEQIQSWRNRSNCARHKPARVQCSVTSGFDRDAATRTGDGCFGAETYMCIPNEIRPPAEHHRRRSQEYGG